MANLGSLLQVIGAGVAGYYQGKKQKEDRDEAKADRDEDREYRRTSRAREESAYAASEKLKEDLAGAQREQTVEEIPSYDVSSMSGGDPTKQPAVGFKANGQVFHDAGAASVALHGVNSQSAKDARAAKVLRESGSPENLDRARQMEAYSKRAIDEGTDQILGAIGASAPSLDDVKKAKGGKVSGTVGSEAADVFNKTGGRWKVSADTAVEHYVDKDATGREFVNSRVMGKDGKPVIEDLRSANLMLADYKTRLEQQHRDTTAAQRQDEITESARRNQSQEAEQRRSNRAQEGVAGARLSLERQRFNREGEQFKNQTPAGQIAEAEKLLGPFTPEERKSYGARLLGLTKGGPTKDTEGELVNDMVKTWATNNPDASAADAARYRQELATSFASVKTNTVIKNTLQDAFAAAPPGSPEYAETYKDAVQQLRMSPADLESMGYKPPAAAGGGKAAPAGRGPIAAAGVSAGQNYRAQQAAQAQAQTAARIATLEKNVAGLSAAKNLTPYARASLAEQQAELARLTGN